MISPDSPGGHRLAKEARRNAQNYGLGRFTLAWTALMSVLAGFVAKSSDMPPSYYWRGAALSLAAAGLSQIRHRRWTARAQWLRDTPDWWERQEEMPTVLTFPRTHAWVNRQFDRLVAWVDRSLGRARSWPGRDSSR